MLSSRHLCSVAVFAMVAACSGSMSSPLFDAPPSDAVDDGGSTSTSSDASQSVDGSQTEPELDASTASDAAKKTDAADASKPSDASISDATNPIDATKPCTSHATAACFANDLWWYDDCGKREDLKQDCANGCGSGACCTTHASTACYQNDVYWFDSCGKREDKKEDCPATCTAGTCAAVTWRCTNNTASTCFCVKTADTLSYPLSSCAAKSCCFEYSSVSGPACYCGDHDAQTCDQYVATYTNAVKRNSCPPP